MLSNASPLLSVLSTLHSKLYLYSMLGRFFWENGWGDLGMWEKIFNFAVQAELRSPGLG